MTELEYGIVDWFDGEEFGYLHVVDKDGQKTGEAILFGLSDGQVIEIGAGQVEWTGPMFVKNAPHIGDKLAFERMVESDGRHKASPWTYAGWYDNLMGRLTPRTVSTSVSPQASGPRPPAQPPESRGRS